MGYTSTHREKGMSDRAFFERELPTTLTVHGEIQACATVGSVFYAAVKNTDDAPYLPGQTWALVCIVRRTRDYFNCTYKEMSEDCGPADARCPARILDLLSPTEVEYAAEWRKACRENAAKTATASKVTKGATIKFAQPIEFSNGAKLDTFTFVERSTFRDAQGFGLYRITNWRTSRAWEVVEDLLPCGCPRQFVADCGHQEGCKEF